METKILKELLLELPNSVVFFFNVTNIKILQNSSLRKTGYYQVTMPIFSLYWFLERSPK